MRNRAITYLVVLAIVDVFIPVPILALMLLFVTWRRPTWFADRFKEVYGA